MQSTAPERLSPRKTPKQTRALATIDAIFEATIQVLLAEGLQRLTTTRVAERAGVSVGTMYQYYPHKQSLLYACLERHLQAVQDEVEQACLFLKGEEIGTMAAGLANAYLAVKTRRSDITRALYLVVAALDTVELVNRTLRSMEKNIATMFESAADVELLDLDMVTTMVLLTLTGTVRALIERDPSGAEVNAFNSHLSHMLRSYVEEAPKRD